MTRRQYALIAAVVVVLALVIAAAVHIAHRHSSVTASSTSPVSVARVANTADDAGSPTTVYAHNILLRKGPDFKVYIRWISGVMEPTKAAEVPSFDDTDTFVLEIQKGVILARLDDIARFLNTAGPTTPLKNVSIEAAGQDTVKIKGTVHKAFALPVEIDGQISSTPDYRIKMHVTKINVLHIPMKGLLGGFHVELDDLVTMKNTPGIQVVDNDIFFNTEKLLPPPHIHGRITSVRVVPPNLEVIYGGVANDAGALAQWHNFLRFEGGSLAFGRLVMHPVDLTMIDASKDAWFDLDLTHYQAQLVNGYTRMTSKAGLEIYMPELDEMPAKSKQPADAITLDWLKHRGSNPPADVPVK